MLRGKQTKKKTVKNVCILMAKLCYRCHKFSGKHLVSHHKRRRRTKKCMRKSTEFVVQHYACHLIATRLSFDRTKWFDHRNSGTFLSSFISRDGWSRLLEANSYIEGLRSIFIQVKNFLEWKRFQVELTIFRTGNSLTIESARMRERERETSEKL